MVHPYKEWMMELQAGGGVDREEITGVFHKDDIVWQIDTLKIVTGEWPNP